MQSKENSTRLVKNTLFLYLRMFLTMAVGLYTSRIVLDKLGVDNYGIYNVVGGVVAMFSIVSSSLVTAIIRFITVELGRSNIERLKTVFSTSVNVQIGISLIIVLLAEIVGVWFLNYKMNIPPDRMYAANWVLQCSILTFCINLISVPYNALIVAHEHMKTFAYVSILEVVLKFVVAISLVYSPYDKLIVYAILLVLVALTIRVVYGIYCKRHFEECIYTTKLDRSLLKEMGSFAGWNFFGSTAFLFNTQGVNILVNMFFGVAFNAARGVATQVDSVVRQFVTNFTTAINPQIMKSYAAGDMEYLFQLICRGAKYSYFLMFIFVVPFVYEADMILSLWLKDVPAYAATFLRLSFFASLADILGNATANAAMATGRIKRYYIWVGSVGCLVFPLSWIAFALGAPATASYIAFILVYTILVFLKVYLIKGLMNFPVRKFLVEVVKPIIIVSILSFVIPGLLYFNMQEGWIRLIAVVIVSIPSTVLLIAGLGMQQQEREFAIAKAKSFVNHKIFHTK